MTAMEAWRGFRERFGREPVGVWSAPGRVNLIGEHTDYNDGFVLPFAIDRRTYVALAPHAIGAGGSGALARVSSALSEEVVERPLTGVTRAGVAGWSAYPLGTVWGLGEVGVDLTGVPGFDAYVTSDVPLGAGLSSSAALECSLALGLAELWDVPLDRDALVTAAQRGENDIVGAPTGVLDQSAALLCEADAALFLDCRDRSHQVVPLPLAEAGLTCLVIDTQVKHAHAGGGYADRRRACERGADELGVAALRDLSAADLARADRALDEQTFRRVRHVVTENQRVLDTVDALRQSGPAAIGELLLASHASMRADFEISTPELDLAVDSALAAGALGARMTGGGFGGAAIALVARDRVAEVSGRVLAAFAAHEAATPSIFAVSPPPGARREQLG
jgi:galactokinase